jgi:membrane protease YdiL (CAAX protease family)
MELNDSGRTSERTQAKLNRLLLTLVVGTVVVHYGNVPLLEWLWPDAVMNDRMVVGKGITFAFFAIAIMRSTGWSAVGFRHPVRPASLLYCTPCFLLAAGALAGGISPEMTLGAFAYMTVWLTTGVLVEEILFRGVMWEALAPKGPYVTAIATSAGFGMFHVLGIGSEIPTTVILAQMCAAVGIGMVIAAVRVSAGTIWTAVIAHWVFNGISFLGSGGVAQTLSSGVEMQLVSAGVVLSMIGLGLVALASRRSRPDGEGRPGTTATIAVPEAG